MGLERKLGSHHFPPCSATVQRLPGTLPGPFTGFSQMCLFTQQSEGSCSHQVSSCPFSAQYPAWLLSHWEKSQSPCHGAQALQGSLRTQLPLLTLLPPHWLPPSCLNPPAVLPLQGICSCWSLSQYGRPAHPGSHGSFVVSTLKLSRLRKLPRPGQNRWYPPGTLTHPHNSSLPFLWVVAQRFPYSEAFLQRHCAVATLSKTLIWFSVPPLPFHTLTLTQQHPSL